MTTTTRSVTMSFSSVFLLIRTRIAASRLTILPPDSLPHPCHCLTHNYRGCISTPLIGSSPIVQAGIHTNVIPGHARSHGSQFLDFVIPRCWISARWSGKSNWNMAGIGCWNLPLLLLSIIPSLFMHLLDGISSSSRSVWSGLKGDLLTSLHIAHIVYLLFYLLLLLILHIFLSTLKLFCLASI